MEKFDPKQSGDEYYISFGFANKLGSATISSFTVTAVDLIDNSDVLSTITDTTLATISGTDVDVWIRAGVNKHDYLLTVKITTSDNSDYEFEGIMPVRDLTSPTSQLIIEDGSLSTASANSYVSTAEVDTYCQQMGYSDWFILSNVDKETAILRAMIFIDAQNFKGHKTGYNNPLAWPRIGVYGNTPHDFSGILGDYEFWSEIPSDSIPKALKRGLCEASYLESLVPGALTEDQETNVKRTKIDIIEIEYFSASPSQPVYTKILKLMKEILEPDNEASHFASVLRT